MSPSQLAAFGLILLGFNPFSAISNDLRLMLAVVTVFIFGAAIKRNAISKEYYWSHNETALRRFASKRITALYAVFFAIFVHAVLCGILSIVVIFDSGLSELFDMLVTAFRQLISLLFSFLEIAAGYYLATHVSPKAVRKVIYVSFILMTAICLYQYLSVSLGLPFIGNYVYDRFVGLRPSGFAAEPKFLSTYIAILAFLLWDDRIGCKLRTLIRFGAIFICVFLFLATSSANGFIGLVLIIAVRLAMLRAWKSIAVIAALAVVGYSLLAQFSLDDIGLRGSHADLLQNLAELDLFMFDDLIFLPLLAWKDNMMSLWIGFGPGLLHYFAKAYMSYATWVTDDVYIKGNISAIGFISQFGLILFAVIFLFILWKVRRLVRMNISTQYRALDLFFLNTFVLGALISGNVSTPFYVSIGWILCRAGVVAQVARQHKAAGKRYQGSRSPGSDLTDSTTSQFLSSSTYAQN